MAASLVFVSFSKWLICEKQYSTEMHIYLYGKNRVGSDKICHALFYRQNRALGGQYARNNPRGKPERDKIRIK